MKDSSNPVDNKNKIHWPINYPRKIKGMHKQYCFKNQGKFYIFNGNEAPAAPLTGIFASLRTFLAEFPFRSNTLRGIPGNAK